MSAEFPRRLGFWGWLDGRAERKEARRLLLIDRGLDARSLARLTFESLDVRLFIAGSIIALFAWAFARATDRDTLNLMVGALIAAFAGAWGYYLGSSNSANQANDRADRATELAHRTVRQLPAPVAAAGAAREVANAAEERAEEIEEGRPA